MKKTRRRDENDSPDSTIYFNLPVDANLDLKNDTIRQRLAKLRGTFWYSQPLFSKVRWWWWLGDEECFGWGPGWRGSRGIYPQLSISEIRICSARQPISDSNQRPDLAFPSSPQADEK